VFLEGSEGDAEVARDDSWTLAREQREDGIVSTLYLLNESQDHLVLSRLHPMLTLVPGYVLEER